MMRADSGSQKLAGFSHKLNPGKFIILQTVFCSSPDLTHRRTTHSHLRHFLSSPARHIQHALLSLGVQITNSPLLRLASIAASDIARHDFSSSRFVPLGLYVHVIGDDVDATSSPPRDALASFDKVERFEAFDKCSVCMEEMCPRGPRVARTLCSHVFHTNCIVNWIKRSPMCPICRKELTI